MSNLKDLPFDQYYEFYQERLESNKVDMLNILRTASAKKYAKQRANITKMMMERNKSSEEGSDGIDEAIAETFGEYNEEEIVLSKEDLKLVKEQVLEEVHESFCTRYEISSNLGWLPYQLIAHFGNWTPVKNETGKYSGVNTLKANCTSDYQKGIAMFALGSRSQMFNKGPRTFPQYKSPIAPLVPIILAGFKQNQEIQYGDWDPTAIPLMVDKDLADAMLCGIDTSDWDDFELLKLRKTANTDKNGKVYSVATSAKVNGLGTSLVKDLPRLAKFMALQTWCAHPSNRTRYMVLDHNNWDTLPEALISSELVSSPVTSAIKWSATTSHEKTSDTPW